MPVSLGIKPQHSFNEPMGLLSDCHRRIEHFLGVLEKVAAQASSAASATPSESPAGPLNAEHRRALEAALTYFRVAAPRHTADEEQSLFPRMRQVRDAATRREVEQAMSHLDALESDHRRADAAHQEVDTLASRWLTAGSLPAADLCRLKELLSDLRQLYQRHIAVEDQEIFPLAQRILPPQTTTAIGHEMAKRRGLEK